MGRTELTVSPLSLTLRAALLCIRPTGGRRWWAHFEFTRINIGPTILRKKIEDLHVFRAFSVRARALRLLKSQKSHQMPRRPLAKRGVATCAPLKSLVA